MEFIQGVWRNIGVMTIWTYDHSSRNVSFRAEHFTVSLSWHIDIWINFQSCFYHPNSHICIYFAQPVFHIYSHIFGYPSKFGSEVNSSFSFLCIHCRFTDTLKHVCAPMLTYVLTYTQTSIYIICSETYIQT